MNVCRWMLHDDGDGGALVCCRLSVRLKQAAGLKNQIMSNVQLKRDNLDSLQPKLNAVMQVGFTHSPVCHCIVSQQCDSAPYGLRGGDAPRFIG